MDKYTKNQIKNEGVQLLRKGYTVPSTTQELWGKYSRLFTSYRQFDNIIGSHCRRVFNNNIKRDKGENTNEKIIPFNGHQNSDGPTIGTGALSKSVCTTSANGTMIETQHPKGAKTQKQILEENGFDANRDEIASMTRSTWQAQAKGGDIIDMEAFKITVRRKATDGDLSDEDIADMIARREEHVSKMVKLTPAPVYQPEPTGKIAVWHIGDLHYGRRCFADQVGIEWNTALCEEDVRHMLSQVVTRLKMEPVNGLILAMTGDGINSDTIDHCTAHGTPQEDGGVHYKHLQDGYFNMVCDIIDTVTEELKIPVNLVHVIGNHDTKTMFGVMLALRVKYSENSNVVILDELNRRKYRKFGKNLFMFSHGDAEKKRISSCPREEAAHAYGTTKYTYIFTEHLHNLKVDTDGRTVVLQCPSPAPADNWTKDSGYLGSRRGSDLFIFDEKIGLLSQNFISVKNEKVNEFVHEIQDIFAA